MNLKKLVNKGRRKLKLSKHVNLQKTKESLKLPVTGTMAQAATISRNEQHIIIVDTSIQDFMLEYKINHELCHAKLNEMDIRSIEGKLKETTFTSNEEKNKGLTLSLIVYEFYAVWMCHDVFGVPKELIYAYNDVFGDLEKVRNILESDLFRFCLEITPFLLYERLGYKMNIGSFFKILSTCRLELIDWTHILHNFLNKLPQLPSVINQNFVDTVYGMILEIYQKNPISLA